MWENFVFIFLIEECCLFSNNQISPKTFYLKVYDVFNGAEQEGKRWSIYNLQTWMEALVNKSYSWYILNIENKHDKVWIRI